MNVLAAFVVATVAAAQAAPPKIVKPSVAKPAEPVAAERRLAPTFEALHVEAAELPSGWKLEKEPAFVSPQPATLLDDALLEAMNELFPAPKRKDYQTISGAGGRGSIVYLEYAPRAPADFVEFLHNLLWGDGKGPSHEHPEWTFQAGEVVVVTSFPEGSAANRFVIDRVRRKFGQRIPRDWSDLEAQLAPVKKCYDMSDATNGLALLRGVAKEFAATSFGAQFEGEFCVVAQDWAGAEKAYARALELDATSDPLPDEGCLFACTDGRGNGLWGLKQWADAEKTLRDAAAIAAKLDRAKDQGHSLYNVACCQARQGKNDEAIATLTESLKLRPEGKTDAAKDEDLASLHSLPAWKRLVGG